MFLKRYISKLIDIFKTKNPPLYYIEGNNPYMNFILYNLTLAF